MGSFVVTNFKPRHNEILRLHFLGRSNVEIGAKIGVTSAAVACVLRSPLAQAELARMKAEADKLIVNTSLRVALEDDLVGATKEALTLNRRLMNEGKTDTKLRSKIATHFLDRVLFDKVGETGDGIYRQILTQLDQMEKNGGVVIEAIRIKT